MSLADDLAARFARIAAAVCPTPTATRTDAVAVAEVRNALLCARQRVRPIVEYERAADTGAADILNLPLTTGDVWAMHGAGANYQYEEMTWTESQS